MSDIENNDTPVNEEQEPEPELLKTKKAKGKGNRNKPRTQKQLEQFQNAFKKRQENIEKRNTEKKIEAAKLLLANDKKKEVVTELKDFILIKKNVSFGMIIVLFLLSVSSLLNWSNDVLYAFQNNTNYPNPNTVFYTDFFSIMILVDVLLLIISFVYNFSFFTIFRNASFIITTILIRLSLTIAKPMNYFMVIIGFLFSVITFYLFSHRNSKKIE
jgi:hypothetical protein